MEFQDRMLKCVDCGNDFVFAAGEQLSDKLFHMPEMGPYYIELDVQVAH